MDRLEELKEAKATAIEVDSKLKRAISSLRKASSWGIWDLFGGEFFTSWMKRRKIKKANKDINSIYVSLSKLNKELSDVNMRLPYGISNSLTDNIFDLWFDNVFTDIRVQREIKNSIRELKALRSEIRKLIRQLKLEIDSYQR